MNKPTVNVGNGPIYVACTRVPPQRGTALPPHRPHGLKSHGDPDAPMWGANFGLAPFSDRPFTLSARALTGLPCLRTRRPTSRSSTVVQTVWRTPPGARWVPAKLDIDCLQHVPWSAELVFVRDTQIADPPARGKHRRDAFMLLSITC